MMIYTLKNFLTAFLHNNSYKNISNGIVHLYEENSTRHRGDFIFSIEHVGQDFVKLPAEHALFLCPEFVNGY